MAAVTSQALFVLSVIGGFIAVQLTIYQGAPTDDPKPELAELLLVPFEVASDICRVFGAAFLIDYDRQIVLRAAVMLAQSHAGRESIRVAFLREVGLPDSSGEVAGTVRNHVTMEFEELVDIVR
jgi:hypothetical protein